MKKELSILIPVYNGDCRQQVSELARQAQAVEGLDYEIIVADDGSTDAASVERCREVEQLAHCRFIARQENVGRAAIRNFLAREAKSQWLLFMDCDMAIPNDGFLRRYLEDDFAQIAYGGYQIGNGENSNLRYLYEKKNLPQHSVEQRRKRPFMHFHTCNFVVQREVILAHPFDERFRHYGYEDVLWGKQLRRAGIKIDHLDNPAGFFTFEDNAHFVAKTEEGLRTLYKFRNDLRGYSQLITFVENIHLPPVRWAICLWHKLLGPLERRNLCGKRPNLKVFALYKLGYYLSLPRSI